MCGGSALSAGEHRADMREVVYRKEIYQEFPTLVLLLYAHSRPQPLCQFTLEKKQLRRKIGLSRALGRYAASDLLRIAHGEFPREYLLKKRLLLCGAVHEHEKRACVAFADVARSERVLHLLREREDAKRVRDVFAAFSYALSYFNVFKAELAHEALERLRAVYRIQILALEVLDDGYLELHSVVVLAASDDHRHLENARKLRRAEPAFSGNKFIFDVNPLAGPLYLLSRDRERLKNAVLPDGFSQRRKSSFIEDLARLEGVRFYAVDLNPKYRILKIRTCHDAIISFGNFHPI